MKWSHTKKRLTAETNSRPLWFTRSALRDAFRRGGCAICRTLHASERSGIHSFLYEGMMSPGVRQKFLDGGGFCAQHFRMAEQIEQQTWPAGGIGIAILCEDLLRVADSDLQNSGRLPANSKFLSRNRRGDVPFLPGHNCMFCRDSLDKERFLLEVLEELMDEREFAEPLSKHGLCIRHTQLTREIWTDDTKRATLFAELRSRLGDLSADLREFIRKHDYQFRHEPPGPEANAVERTMGVLVGSRGETSMSRPER